MFTAGRCEKDGFELICVMSFSFQKLKNISFPISCHTPVNIQHPLCQAKLSAMFSIVLITAKSIFLLSMITELGQYKGIPCARKGKVEI